MKWWEKLEAGSTVCTEGDSEVKGSFTLHPKLQVAFSFH